MKVPKLRLSLLVRLLPLAKYLLFVIPLIFLIGGVMYRDPFIVALAVLSFFAILFSVLPWGKVSMKSFKIKIPKLKKKDKNLPLEEKIVEEVVELTQENKRNPVFQALVLFMIFLVCALSAFGIQLYLLLNSLPAVEGDRSLLMNFALANLAFFKDRIVFILAGAIALSILLGLISLFQKKKQHRNKKIKHFFVLLAVAIVMIVVGGAVGKFSALGVAYALAQRDLQHIVQEINDHPDQVQIVAGKDAVLAQLNTLNSPPQISTNETPNPQDILNDRLLTEHHSAFYVHNLLLAHTAQYADQVHLPHETLVLVGNHLYIERMERDQLEAISPTLAKLLVTAFFQPRVIKDKPGNLSIITRQEYYNFRDEEINKKITDLNNAIAAIDRQIASVTSQMQQIFSDVVTAQDAGDSSKDGEIPTFLSLQNQRETLLQHRATLAAYKEIVSSQKSQVGYELGIFEPKDTIKVVLDTTDQASTDRYFATLTHEYLHYASYISDERTLPSFFEEGLTEYFARKVVKKEVGRDTKIGYPLYVKIIEALAQKVSDKDLEEIYFTKDADKLRDVLDAAYGKNFYENSAYYFAVLPFADEEDSLKFANNIMYAIGAKEIHKEDLPTVDSF